MPRIGLSTVCFIAEPFAAAVDFILNNGFAHIEVYADIPHAWPGGFGFEERRSLRRRLDQAGISASVHGPAYGLNIASLNPGLRRETVEQIKAACRMAGEIGAENVVIHSGSHHYLHPGLIAETERLSEEIALHSLAECVIEAEACGVVLCLENLCTPGAVPAGLTDVVKAVRMIGRDSLRVTLDIAHFGVAGEDPARITPALPWIQHVHISDHDGRSDLHLPLGEGIADLDPFLPFLRSFNGPLVLEVEHVGEPGPKALVSRRWLAKTLQSAGNVLNPALS